MIVWLDPGARTDKDLAVAGAIRVEVKRQAIGHDLAAPVGLELRDGLCCRPRAEARARGDTVAANVTIADLRDGIEPDPIARPRRALDALGPGYGRSRKVCTR